MFAVKINCLEVDMNSLFEGLLIKLRDKIDSKLGIIKNKQGIQTEFDHIVSCLGEECGEVSQLIGKVGRFGIDCKDPKTGIRNVDNIVIEVHDIIAIYKMFCKHVNIPQIIRQDLIEAKITRVRKYMRLAAELGRLEMEDETNKTAN
jgi:NTP pyrophosphatase (non-canonical NTP hydrolase)